MNHNIRIYVAGAYSGPTLISGLDNIRRGLKLSWEVLKVGYSPFCPWFDFFFSLVGETTLSEYQDYSLSFVETCHAMLLVQENLKTSKGTQREIERAEALGIPIFNSLVDLMEVMPPDSKPDTMKVEISISKGIVDPESIPPGITLVTTDRDTGITETHTTSLYRGR